MKANQEFLKDPYQSGKNVLGPKCAIQLQCNHDLLDTLITKTSYEPSYNTLLPSFIGLPPVSTLLKDLNSTSVRYQDLLCIVNTWINACLPGINVILYQIYKGCLWISSFLFKIFITCPKVSNVPTQWGIASELYILKKNPSNWNNSLIECWEEVS